MPAIFQTLTTSHHELAVLLQRSFYARFVFIRAILLQAMEDLITYWKTPWRLYCTSSLHSSAHVLLVFFARILSAVFLSANIFKLSAGRDCGFRSSKWFVSSIFYGVRLGDAMAPDNNCCGGVVAPEGRPLCSVCFQCHKLGDNKWRLIIAGSISLRTPYTPENILRLGITRYSLGGPG